MAIATATAFLIARLRASLPGADIRAFPASETMADGVVVKHLGGEDETSVGDIRICTPLRFVVVAVSDGAMSPALVARAKALDLALHGAKGQVDGVGSVWHVGRTSPVSYPESSGGRIRSHLGGIYEVVAAGD